MTPIKDDAELARASVAKRSPRSRKKSRKQTEAEIEAAASEQLERITGATNEQLQGYIVEQLINKHGVKLLTLYARQLEAMDKHRGKGQQNVTVEHVNVEAGGRAIDGHVATDKAPQADEKSVHSSTKAIDHKPGDILDMEPQGAPQKAKRKTRKTRR